MPRSRKKGKKSQREPRRFAKYELLRDIISRHDYRQVEDRRRWHPNWIEAKLLDGRSAEVYSPKRIRGKPVSLAKAGISFADPKKVITCKRRKDRRKSLFALKKIGKGSGGKKFKKRKYTERSKVRC